MVFRRFVKVVYAYKYIYHERLCMKSWKVFLAEAVIRLNWSVYAPHQTSYPHQISHPFFATCEYAKTPANAMHIVAKFIGTRMRKNNTEEAMTTTLFAQFPTECVTGVTCKIIYETCWYNGRSPQ